MATTTAQVLNDSNVPGSTGQGALNALNPFASISALRNNALTSIAGTVQVAGTQGGQFYYNASDTTTGWTGTLTISGTTLTIVSTTSGAMAANLFLNSGSGAWVVSGSGATWTLSSAPGNVAVATAATADNGGTIVIDTLGRRWYRVFSGRPSVAFWGMVGSGSDETSPLRAAASVSNALFFPVPSGTAYVIAGQIFAGVTMPDGLYWEAATGRSTADTALAAGGVNIQFTGAGIMCDFQNPNGAPNNTQYGGHTFKNLQFSATQNGGSIFRYNNPSTVDGGGNPTQGVAMGINFKNCTGYGPGASSTGYFLQATRAFEIVIDSDCEIRSWNRGVDLHGCDNGTIQGRIYANGRNICHQAAGNYGNNLRIDAQYCGNPTVSGSGEASYSIYDTGTATSIRVGELEAVSAGSPTAAIYFGGVSTRVLPGTWFNNQGIPYFELGPSALDVVIFGAVGAGVAPLAPIIDAATSYDVINNYGGAYFGATLVDCSANFNSYCANLPRIRIYDNLSNSVVADAAYWLGRDYLGANGPVVDRVVINSQNYSGQTAGTSFGAIAGIVADAASYNGAAIQIAATNLSGFTAQATVGKGINNGDAVNITAAYKMSSATYTGTFNLAVTKNGTVQAVFTLPASASYTTFSQAYTLSGFSAGDKFGIGVYNNSVSAGITCSIESITREVVRPTTNVLGGTNPLVTSTSAITSGAGANTGTLTNAPSAGNPTKWIPINDNGTTRYVPAW